MTEQSLEQWQTDVLFELYDGEDPLSNLIAVLGLQPKQVYFFGEMSVLRRSGRQEAVRRGVRALSPETEVFFELVNPYDAFMVCARIESLILDHNLEECAADLTGGHDLLLFAMGKVCSHYDLAIVIYRPGRHGLLHIGGPYQRQVTPVSVQPDLTHMFIAMGASWLRYGHSQSMAGRSEAVQFAPKILELQKNNPAQWLKLTRYMQQAVKADMIRNGASDLPTVITAGNVSVGCPLKLMLELNSMGMFSHLAITSGTVQLAFYNPDMQYYLTDYGIWLELYVYGVLRESGLFDSVETSMVVSWDNDDDPKNNIENEIDVVGMRGIGQLFISCKTGAADQFTLNELFTLTRRFGSKYAAAALVCLRDIRNESPKLMIRAEQLGITIICGEDLKREVLLKKIASITQRWKNEVDPG